MHPPDFSLHMRDLTDFCLALQAWLHYFKICLPSLHFFFFRSLAVGSRLGYKLFSLNSVEKLEEIHDYGKLKWQNKVQFSQGFKCLLIPVTHAF